MKVKQVLKVEKIKPAQLCNKMKRHKNKIIGDSRLLLKRIVSKTVYNEIKDAPEMTIIALCSAVKNEWKDSDELAQYIIKHMISRSISLNTVEEYLFGISDVVDVHLHKTYENNYHSYVQARKILDETIRKLWLRIVEAHFEHSYKRIRDLKDKFEKIFNYMPDPIVIVDYKGKILDVSKSGLRITGYKKKELVGKNFMRTKLFSIRDKELLVQKLVSRMMGKTIRPYNVEVITKKGKKILFEINAEKIVYEGIPSDMVVFRRVYK